ncbi:MAG: RidA family protein [Mucilaginibacter polytrichastri]|nr:RidA family protein [Mucilaginibacter polytrichastri]
MSAKIIRIEKAPAPIGPYNQAVLAGNTLYVSGQIALDPTSGELRQGSVEEETELVMANLKAILEEAGSSFSQVVKSTIFLKDMNDFQVVNGIYGSFFTADFPARETVQVAALPKNVRVEISVIAYLG